VINGYLHHFIDSIINKLGLNDHPSTAIIPLCQEVYLKNLGATPILGLHSKLMIPLKVTDDNQL
jgi:hypothetical protein